MAKHRGFSLVELLVVVGIISILVAMLLPALNKARFAAGSVACLSNIRQIGVAGIMYANAHKGILGPPGDGSGGYYNQGFYLNGNGALYPMGAWIVRSYASGKMMFCPAESYIYDQYITTSYYLTDPSIDNRYHSIRWVPGGNPPFNYDLRSTYCFNMAAVMGNTGLGDPWNTASGPPVPLSKSKPDWPMIADARIPGNWYFNYSAHLSRGYNVFYADGSARWIERRGAINPTVDSDFWMAPNVCARGGWPIWTYFRDKR